MSRAALRRVVVAVIAVVVLVAACESESPTPDPSSSAGQPSVQPSASQGLSSFAGLWVDATAETIGSTGKWTNKVEIAELNGDGFPDLVFPNGGDYESPGTPVATQVFFSHSGTLPLSDDTAGVMGDLMGIARVAKAADLDGQGPLDLILGMTYQTQSHLLLGAGAGLFVNATNQLPQLPLSVGDIDVGDVDADGDLDLVLADWGPGSPMDNEGGQVHLWLNDGSGHFREATDQMPSTLVRFSWELELVDVDNDWDLDLAVSAKMSSGSFLYENDGTGQFTDVTAGRLPQFANNYDFEAMDLDLDGFLDLVTINDGDNPTGEGGREHVFRNDGTGSFVDVTSEWWPDSENPGEDDNNSVFLDVDSDGDADFLIGSLTGPDRLMINDGSGHLAMELAAFDAPISAGTLGMTVVDFDLDGRWDVVEAQGETPGSEDERIYLATDRLAPDTSPPVLVTDLQAGASGDVVVHARAHDFMAFRPLEMTVLVTWDGALDRAALLGWYGELLFRGEVTIPVGVTGLRVCATDAHANETCVPIE